MITMMRRRIEELGLAVSFMTRLPVPPFEVRTGATLASGFWALPLAGVLVGAIGGGVLWLGEAAGLSERVAAILAIAAMVLATGALHEDGLADFADGVGGGKTIAQRLEIMRDSRIGTYGVLALILAVGMQVEVLASLEVGPRALFLLIVAAALARAMLVVPLTLLQPARADGLAVYFGTPSVLLRSLAVIWPLALAALLLPPAMMVALAGGATLAAMVVTALAGRYLGGSTGDVMGAVVVLGFTFGLMCAVIAGGTG